MLNPEQVSTMLIRIPAKNISSSLKQIEKIWNKMLPMYPFTYSFLDEDFNRRYRGIQQIGSLGISFAIIAILVACLGLFGLALYITAQRSKEIGIRKVLGASVPKITFLLSKEFVRCVVIANLIAWPLAYVIMNKWLFNFAFRTTLDIWIFILAGFISLSIALFTVSYQSIRSASANPVETLRYE
jgi:putative ABC transport system permease protein